MSKKMISFEISDGLREVLRVEAFNKRMTLSALIRQVLEEKFNIKNETAGPLEEDNNGRPKE